MTDHEPTLYDLVDQDPQVLRDSEDPYRGWPCDRYGEPIDPEDMA